MIAFAVVDGKLHKNEFQFLSLIAEDLEINPTEFQQLFHSENQTEVIKDDFERIQQFYRLALTNVMSARVKIGSVESKKGLLFFITALSFDFKWSLEWSLLKRLEKPNVTKQTIGERPFDCTLN